MKNAEKCEASQVLLVCSEFLVSPSLTTAAVHFHGQPSCHQRRRRRK